jgi:6-phosphogluconolactonase/glucosamine-6-phosphate isomerase/deaminase
MQYILSSSPDEGVDDLIDRLTHELAANKRVLWLISGGSNITLVVKIMTGLSSASSSRLTIMLVDERYGKVGHQDSNWAQLLAAGLEPKQATVVPVLVADMDFEQTAARYQELVLEAFQEANSVIAQLGIGPDGHIAGILPNSIAAHEDVALAIGYDSQPFQRLTLTFPALCQITTAYVFAFGDTKQQALTSLENQDIPLDQQPAQILKQLPEVFIYSDQLGNPS